MRELRSRKQFLKPSIKHSIANPYDMKDMNKAIDRIIKAINEKDPIPEI